ncbi:double-strand break repair protein AddB [Phenylobacterium sp. J426]|uniref:double-strand break repair protein AddB n=1 Tax=Phenylobacterium sp. J426 TaxID=2898439 RepID=UPI00215070B4|nr:double-strand break repair protein AddB [Phenylobacterium sp. J426]MCR5873624.1 double-strand break repair protein AddB [Phenylobacterium sp. J426]
MTAFFERPGPRWFNIPAHRPFADDLARGLYEALSPFGPEALSDALVLTPTRRGARAVADAFVRAAEGRAVLPPQMRPLGDLEAGEPPFEPGDLALDLPAAIDPLRRRFELTRLVAENWSLLPGRELTASSALELADALGGFLDSLQIEEVEAGEKLAGLVEADLAEHWRVSRDFLETALVEWPKRLSALGVVDVSERRVRLLRRLAEVWTAKPPQGVLVAAGSTGTAPATADLLAVIAAAPRGSVVVPGLDDSLAETAWKHVDEQHPQGALRRLLGRSGIDRENVEVWPASLAHRAQGRWRRRVVNEALRPPRATADWLRAIDQLRAEAEAEGIDPVAEGLRGLSLASARSEEEAATVAALLLREALETPDKTAALVTPDQVLARRVVAKLGRWGIAPDSSAGESLAGCRCGVLAGLVAKALVDALAPVNLLALLKHPYVRLGLEPDDLGRRRELLERHALRGARPWTWATLRARLADKGQAALPLVDRLEALLGAPPEEGAVADLARAVTATMEALAADADGRTGDLWSGHGGEAMSRLLAGLIHETGGLPEVSARGFADLLSRLMEGETVRSGGATHPRLRILGAIEARLVRADRLVVAGLEEGVWPRGAPLDPFLSRPMRQTLGLPPPERRVGLAAHDFAQAACAPEVILLHSERREGQPAVKSRWLWRLETLARGAGVDIPDQAEALAWARRLDPPDDYQPVGRPAPCPPVEARPRELFVTRVETLTRDPYAVWARDILNLRLLDRPDEPVEARARGTAIHAAFERFALAHPAELPPGAAAIFEGLYVEELEKAGMPREALARESALAREAAAWVAELEARRRADGRAIHVEKTGKLPIRVDGHEVVLGAKADRIEADPQGYGHILDYKTGRAPSQKVVDAGFSPQLTLTAAILAHGGFGEIGRLTPGELVYLEVTGRRPAGREEVRASVDESAHAAEQALDGARRLLARYFQRDQPYVSRTAPQFVKTYASDYDHLARVFEWSTSGEEGEA